MELLPKIVFLRDSEDGQRGHWELLEMVYLVGAQDTDWAGIVMVMLHHWLLEPSKHLSCLADLDLWHFRTSERAKSVI